MPVDVQAIGCDFYAVTGHKLYGPSGSARSTSGPSAWPRCAPSRRGDMIREVTRETCHLGRSAHEIRGRHPGIVNQIGLGVALDYLSALAWTTSPP